MCLDDLIDFKQALEVAGCSHVTLRRALYLGQVQGRRLGSGWVLSRSDLERWSRRRLRTGRPPRLPQVVETEA